MLCAILLIPVLFSGASAADRYLFSIGTGLGLTTLNSGSRPWFTVGSEYHLNLGSRLKSNWSMELIYNHYRVYDDSDAESEFSLLSQESDRTRTWTGFDLSLIARHRLYLARGRVAFNLGFGGGISSWRMTDPETESILITTGVRGGPVDFKATEILFSGVAGTEYIFHPSWRIGLDFYANYLTGLGREFSGAAEDSIGQWNPRLAFSLTYMFGEGESSKPAELEKFLPPRPVSPPASSDSVSAGELALVIEPEPAIPDSDNDGIPDFRDRCPGTPPEAAGLVDIMGCPIDSDLDGIPDYIDQCPDNRRGAFVDVAGCPVDTDHDGVPDGLDECPGTEPGFRVDPTGCIDLYVLNKPIRLNVRYRPNSFEIDPFAKRQLDSLALILKQARTITVEINAYTDDRGTAMANRKLSRKRANRVRDYLVSRGISTERIAPLGRGEINFVASNDTPEGRQKNRRVELIFYK